MLIVTTDTLDGRPVRDYLGLVVGQAVVGTNVMKSFRGGIRDIGNARPPSYAGELEAARAQALQEVSDSARKLGADAVVGLRMEHQSVGETHHLVMVTLMGTAVLLGDLDLRAHDASRPKFIGHD
jgi:uncharacterized protein YbjQ (UPF0145 family)